MDLGPERSSYIIMILGHLNLGNCCPVTEAANRSTLLTGGSVDDG